ncbi:MAG: DUF3365 domain-containing protein [Sphingomicrobium sp.]
MKIRAKFNLMMLGVSAAGVGIFILAADQLVRSVARQEVIQSARLMMDGASGARKYTSEQITPLIKDRMEHHFYPQAVSAYAAKRSFDVIRAKYPDYAYREASLNPTSSQDAAADWEADIINSFRVHPKTAEISFERATPTGRYIELARPILVKQVCLECHSTAAAAPRSMVAIYGSRNGFGWKLNEVAAAQVVSVPIQVSAERAAYIRRLFVVPFAGFLIVMCAAINLLLNLVVVRPIERIAATAEAVSMGDLTTPEYVHPAADEIGRLSQSFNRMHRTVVEAFRMLGQAEA